MPNKNQTVSVRLDDSSAAFLNGFQIDGAETVSEKIRAIINRAEEREAGRHSYAAALKLADSLLDPVRTEIFERERANNHHSALLRTVYEWLPETLAFVLASIDPEPDGGDEISPTELESGVADRVFRLSEAIARMALTRPNPCYDKDVISQRMQPSLQLLHLIRCMDKGDEK